MGLLHKLWDETLAGPAPDSGLGRLRKYGSVSASASTSPASPSHPNISRCITLVRSSSDPTAFPVGSPSSSAATSPRSPKTPVGDFKKLTRRKASTQTGRAEDTR